MKTTIFELAVGDITQQRTDGIVNAANARLLGGSGVDGAIHRAAGPELLEACRALKSSLPGGLLATGSAVITPGFQLKARHVIHCVGPRWGVEERAESLLAECYRNCLAVANANELHSISFPAISTGIYGYPPSEACGVVVQTMLGQLKKDCLGGINLVRFVLFDQEAFQNYAHHFMTSDILAPQTRIIT